MSKPRASKHKKKAWKHIDLREIDQYYEDKGLDERTGRTGLDSYFISKEGDSNNLNVDSLNKKKSTTSWVTTPITRDKKQQDSADSSLSKRILGDLKIYKHLQPASAVPAFKTNEPLHPKQPTLQHIRLKSKEQKQIHAVELLKKQRQMNNELNATRQSSLKQTSLSGKPKTCVQSAFDIWSSEVKTPIGDTFVEYAEDFEHMHRANTYHKCVATKQIPKLVQKPSLLPACEQPHPGLSYNPAKQDHQELLLKVAEAKKAAIRDKKKLARKVKSTLPIGLDPDAEFAREMMQGLRFGDENESNEEDKDEQTTEEKDEQQATTLVLQSDLKRRKSKKQARHELLVKRLKNAARKRKESKKFEAEFTKLRQYLREIRQKEEAAKERRKKRDEAKVERLYKPAKLGKQVFVEQDPEFNLTSELNGSLRAMNADGNPLVDRFKSLQRRNLIEHRLVLKMLRSKAKRKMIVNQSIYNKDLFEHKSGRT